MITIETILLVLAYAFLGGEIKYVDQAFDRKIFDRRFALCVSLIGAFTAVYISTFDPYSATIFIAIVAGELLAKKVDNIAFYITTIVVIPGSTTALFVIIPNVANGYEIFGVSLVIMIVSLVLDEVVHDYFGKKSKKGITAKFAYYRPFIKMTLFSLVCFGIYPIIYLAAFMIFEISYISIDNLSHKRFYRRGLSKLDGD